ncbi:hypothetical protein TB1_009214 [Malus domestica]
MSIIGILSELEEIIVHLKSEFEIKDLRKTRYCLSLKIEHCSNEILVHRSNYIQKVLRRFNKDKSKPSSTPMVIQTLDAKRDPFRPKKDKEEILEPEVPYLSAIGALLYFAQCTRPNISFVVNLLARYNSAPTRFSLPQGYDEFVFVLHPRILKISCHPLGLRVDSHLVGYADTRYLSDPYMACSQMGYVFIVGVTAISWRFIKQTLVATSSNHVEILAMHEASCEYFWLRAVMAHIRSTSGFTTVVDLPTTIFEDNAACIEELNKGYIMGDNTKHIVPKFFYSHQE